MKVSFIVPEIVRSGGMRVIFEYAGRLSQKGHEVTLYSPFIPFNPYKGQFNFNFTKYRIKYGLKNFTGKSVLPDNIFPHNFEIRYVPFVNNYFVDDADALIATSWTTSYFVDNLNSKKGKKSYLVQDFEIWNCNSELSKKSYLLDLQKISVSDYLKKFLQKNFQTDSAVIMPGINYSVFSNKNKLFGDKKVLSFADHSLENKNIKGAVGISVRLKEKYPELEIIAFGNSQYNKFPDFINFVACKDDSEVRDIYCKTSVFLFPSLYEGFGLPPAEAMACQCAVVGNKVAAFQDYSVNNVSAVHCNPDNPDELFEGVCSLLDDNEKLKRISETASVEIRKVLDWNKSTDKFEELIF